MYNDIHKKDLYYTKETYITQKRPMCNDRLRIMIDTKETYITQKRPICNDRLCIRIDTKETYM